MAYAWPLNNGELQHMIASMIGMYWPAIICAAAALGLMFAEFAGNLVAQKVLKPLAAAMFVMQAVISGAFDTTYGLTILLGLVACLCGDVLLLSRQSRALFLGGMAAFAIGHIIYIFAFALAEIEFPRAMLRAGVLLVLVLFGVQRWLRHHVPADMLTAVLGYTIIILAMVVSAFGGAAAGLPAIVPVAGVMFAISDMAVTRDRFVKQEPLNAVIITPLYFGAQILFAISVAFPPI